MTASRQTKRAWEKKFEAFCAAETKAKEDVLVAIHQARQDGLTQDDIAYMVDQCSASGVKAKDDKGKAILERRRGNKGGPTTP